MSARPGAAPARVLLVEDERGMRELLAGALRRAGYDVTEARHGGELLACVDGHLRHLAPPFDLVISDIQLPIVSGLHAVEALRRAGCMHPVIFLTAYGDEETHAHARELGARMFDKPFRIEELLVAVRATLQSTAALAATRHADDRADTPGSPEPSR
jgi:two-component system response regulator MprA